MDTATASSSPPTPDAIIATVVEKAKAASGSDTALMELLESHLLTTTPHASAVDNALEAIQKLAEERAEGPINE